MIIYEAPQFVLDDTPFYLEWTPAGNIATEPSKDKWIIRQSDLGLFEGLQKPLSDREQFDALEKKLLDYCENILSSNRESTFGIEVFCGNIEDILKFPWDARQESNFQTWKQTVDPLEQVADNTLKHHYASYLLQEFIDLLTSGVPEQLEWFARVDASNVKDDLEFYQLANRARYEHLHIFWKGSNPNLMADLVWDVGVPSQGYVAPKSLDLNGQDAIQTAWCLPSAWEIRPEVLQQQRDLMSWLESSGINSRPIPQEKISLYWQGLDTIFAFSQQMKPAATRQLAGFCAAGGTVVTIGQLLGLPNEESFDTFCKHYAKT